MPNKREFFIVRTLNADPKRTNPVPYNAIFDSKGEATQYVRDVLATMLDVSSDVPLSFSYSIEHCQCDVWAIKV